MAEPKKYTSIEALKLDERPADRQPPKEQAFSEFEAFLKQLLSEYSNKKKPRKC